jgi:signal transduction histidine kinase
MDAQQPINVVILGAGKGGTALIELFSRSAQVKIVGVADSNPESPGLALARSLNIPTTHDAASLITQNGANLIVDVTGDPALGPVVLRRKPPDVEALSGTAAKLLWTLVQRESELQTQLIHAEKLATLGTFASGIAHDLNSPLQCVLGFAQLIVEEPDPEVVKSNAREIIEAVRHMAAMSRSLTLYARGNVAGEATDVALDDIMDKAVRMVQYGKEMNDVTIVRVYQSALRMQADAVELLQIFVNLITNAVQAMHGRGQLTLAAWPETGGLRASVTDSGPGVPMEHQDKIFKPFFTTKEPGKGTGLGLYIAETIVSKMGGRMWVESDQGKGAAFHLFFPVTGGRQRPEP